MVVGVIVLLVAVAAVVVLRQGATPGQPAQAIATGSSTALPGAHADYVGGKACAECHAKDYAAWHGSRHDLAMQVADDKSVLGNFGDAKFTYAGITSTFFKRDGAFFVNTDGPDGKLADFAIKYTFGVHPLQQYLIEFPGGRMQALGSRGTRARNRKADSAGFTSIPGRISGPAIRCTGRGPPELELHVRRVPLDQPAQEFRRRVGEFKTTWSELDVSCEACHGPGSRHVAWAKKQAGRQGFTAADMGLALALDERKGVTWSPVAATGNAQRSAPRTTAREIEMCARCHARASRFSDDYVHGKPPLDTHRLVAARRRPVLERRADARRGLQLGLVRAEPHVREGRHLLRLPRSALARG